MIGTSLAELVFIRIAITLLRLVAPLSLIYLAAEYWRGTLDFASPLALYALLESGFFALVYIPRKGRLQKVGTLYYRPHPSRTFVMLDHRSLPSTRFSRENSARSSSGGVPTH